MAPLNPSGKHLAEIHRASLIPKNTRETARHYTDKGVAREINDALRAGKRLDGKPKRVADALLSAFTHVKPTTQEGTVYRALRGTQLTDYMVGGYRTPPVEFTSTSLSSDVAWGYARKKGSGDVWELVAKPGSHVLDVNLLIGSQQSHEDEILLAPGVHLKVINVRNRPDGLPGKLVTLELWPN